MRLIDGVDVEGKATDDLWLEASIRMDDEVRTN
jgi:hypothetical protein